MPRRTQSHRPGTPAGAGAAGHQFRPKRTGANISERANIGVRRYRGLSDAEAARDTGEGRAVALARAQRPRVFERRCQWRHAHPKEWLLEQNDIGTDIYFLTSGVVRVLITPSPDREVILGDIEAGGYFGEMAAIDGQPRSAGILAITDATIARMPAVVFREIIHKYPDVSEQLLLQLVARIRTLDQRVNEFSSMHVKNRIYAELLRRSRPDPTDSAAPSCRRRRCIPTSRRASARGGRWWRAS